MSRQAEALEWMATTFGEGWDTALHPSHRINVAIPLAYCATCGHSCGDRQHWQGLRKRCVGPPPVGSTWIARLRHIEANGRHPTKPTVAVSLPPCPVLRNGVVCAAERGVKPRLDAPP